MPCLQVANQKFADVILAHYEHADIVWVQDYHLMLLPALLKQVVAKVRLRLGVGVVEGVCSADGPGKLRG